MGMQFSLWLLRKCKKGTMRIVSCPNLKDLE